ncbi:MAG: hypothetical protein ACPGC9_02455, partial [Cytophagales bacterium]
MKTLRTVSQTKTRHLALFFMAAFSMALAFQTTGQPTTKQAAMSLPRTQALATRTSSSSSYYTPKSLPVKFSSKKPDLTKLALAAAVVCILYLYRQNQSLRRENELNQNSLQAAIHEQQRLVNQKPKEIQPAYKRVTNEEIRSRLEFNRLLQTSFIEKISKKKKTLANADIISLIDNQGNFVKDHEGNTRLHYLCKIYYKPESLNMLLDFLIRQSELDINALNKKNETPFHCILKDNRGNSMQLSTSKQTMALWLIKNGANTNLQDNDGSTVLHLVMSEPPSEIIVNITLRIMSMANLNLKNNVGDTIFHVALKNGRPNRTAIQAMLELSANYRLDMRLCNKAGHTLLHLASMNKALALNDGYECVMQATHHQDDDTKTIRNIQDAQGCTALHHVSWCNDRIDFLLNNSVNPHIKDKDGNIFLHWVFDFKKNSLYMIEKVTKALINQQGMQHNGNQHKFIVHQAQLIYAWICQMGEGLSLPKELTIQISLYSGSMFHALNNQGQSCFDKLEQQIKENDEKEKKDKLIKIRETITRHDE